MATIRKGPLIFTSFSLIAAFRPHSAPSGIEDGEGIAERNTRNVDQNRQQDAEGHGRKEQR